MRRLFERAGVDYRQWRALVRAHIWIDYAALLGAYGAREARRTAVRLVIAWSFLTAMSFSLGLLAWLADDLFFAATSVVSTMMFWSGLVVLGQPAALAAPDDQDIVGFRPVGSRTLFAVRVAALLVPCLETATLLGWVPVVAFASRGEGSLALGAAAALAMVGATAFVTLALVTLFAWLLRVVSPARLAQALAYAGAAAALALTVAVVVVTNRLADADDPGAMFDRTLPRDLRTLWFPGAWFAAYTLIAEGSARPLEYAAALLSVLALAGIAAQLRGSLAIDYSARVTEFAAASAQRRPGVRTWRALRGETRAVFVLVAHHLRGDVRFQLAVASNLSMGLLFILMTSSFALPEDPFLAGGGGPDAMAPLMALFFVPSQIYQSVVMSTAHDAAWLYFSTPSQPLKLLVAARNAIAGLILLPAFLLLTAFYSYAFGHVGHAALQALVLGLVGYAAFQGNVLVAPRLPFSVPITGTRGAGPSWLSPLIVMLVGSPVFIAVQLLAYRSWIHTLTTLAVLVALNALLDWLLRRRVARNPSLLAYSS